MTASTLASPLSDLSAAAPTEIDTILERLDDEQRNAGHVLARTWPGVHRAAGDTLRRRGRREVWTLSHEEARAAATIVAQGGTPAGHRARTALDAVTGAEAEVDRLAAEQRPYTAEWDRRGGWTRAFKAQIAGGHIHSSRWCPTLHRGEEPTPLGWMIDWSGATEEQIVDDAGEAACTICYPSAPVGEAFKRPTRMFTRDEIAEQGAREARAAKKAAREAEKAAKAIATPDGTPLKVFRYRVPERVVRGRSQPAHDTFETLETLHAARGWLTDAHDEHYGASRPSSVQHVAEAIAHKEGKPVDQVITEAKDRARRRRR